MTETEQAGPVDLIFLRFAGNQFDGSIGPALADLVVRGIVRVIDLLFVFKDVDGTTGSIELGDLTQELRPSFAGLDGQFEGGLLDEEDVDEIAAGLEPGNSVAALVIENLWATPFIAAVRAAGGDLVDQARIPSETVAAARRSGQSTH